MSTEKKNRPSNMTPEDHAALDAAGEAYNKATTDEERVKAHSDAEAVRAKYNYSGGADGSQSTPVPAAQTGVQSTQTTVKPIQQQAQSVQQLTAQVPDFTGLLDAWMNSAKEQQNAAIDYATNKGVEELERAEADAQAEFDTQQNQINIDEAKALDNQALYAEARGDKGGIGQAQFGQIQATAMTNRRAINSARTKLSTDTARALADLRAQGEFQKADALLQLTQTYLGQLTELQQWGAEYALSVDQFNIQLQQWQAEYSMEMQKYLTGVEQWDKEFGYTVSQNERNRLAESGMAALSVGMRPSASQQAAMGYTDAQIDAAIAQYELAQKMALEEHNASIAKKTGGNPVTTGGGITPVGGDGLTGVFVEMFNAGKTNYYDVYEYLRKDKQYSEGDAKEFAEEYLARLEDGSLERTANNAPQVDLSDIPGWVLADLKERLVGIDRADENAVAIATVNHLNTLIDKKIITEDQAYRIGASIGLPY